MLFEHFARQWWTFIVRGLLAIAFGILTVAAPQFALVVLVFGFGIYALADGISSLAALLRPHWESGWWLALSGLLGIAAGVVALLFPEMTALSLLLIIAVWTVLVGIMEISAAIAYGDEIDNVWLLGLAGIVFVGFGVISFLWPASGLAAVVAVIATFSFIRGVMLLVVGGRMRDLSSRIADARRIPLTPAG